MFPTLPVVSTMLASTTAYMTDLFTALLPWALAGLGLVLAGVFIKFIVGKLSSGIRNVVGKKKGGKRRRTR